MATLRTFGLYTDAEQRRGAALLTQRGPFWLLSVEMTGRVAGV